MSGPPRGPSGASNGASAGARPAALPYNPALDGIRAVAVLAVMLFHGGVSWAPGGFLGVDVFFVLSGYLITTLLLRERVVAGAIDLRRFWLRRIRRLLPALLVLLAAVGVAAPFVVDPAERASLRGDGLAALFYVANWRFVVTEQSYFAGVPSLLRHLWSLSVEEQWYLVFPLLLVLALRRRPPTVVLLAVALALAAAGINPQDQAKPGGRDVYSYLMQGAMQRDGFDPYTQGAAVNPGPYLLEVSHDWRNTTTPYGPLHLWIGEGVTRLVGDNVTAGVLVYKLISVLGFVAIAWAVPRIARELGGDPALALWLGVATVAVAYTLFTWGLERLTAAFDAVLPR